MVKLTLILLPAVEGRPRFSARRSSGKSFLIKSLEDGVKKSFYKLLIFTVEPYVNRVRTAH